ncbi:uncharacterized protein EKO05_0000343 [Ascochyta rabiei]|uniref:Uncharacterized protein n=1 Tax=Didymella rabiei TaxID=5454 RepID=A0A162VCG7_DIDRA|nr:uncharacterized protein EKO05_0000343 [Ascochyta rabiei]KZM18361.1 hypothetical protein ST47_g10452 [Ascochyta rabiei]UPX09659.1 hypothetical protein EKO05_0000343 [Ascochyta rabiei]
MFCFRRFVPIWTVVVVVTFLFFVTHMRPGHQHMDQEEAIYYRSIDTLFRSEKDALLQWTRSTKQPLKVETDHWLDWKPTSK